MFEFDDEIGRSSRFLPGAGIIISIILSVPIWIVIGWAIFRT